MSGFRDEPEARRFVEEFTAEDGTEHEVWADYAVRGGARVILHVEAEPGLRGSGAAGRFMQSMAEHARENGLRLFPRCSYAVTWHKRHPDYDDVLA